MWRAIISCFVSYVLGSYPTSYFVTKLFTGKNVYETGDRNIGGTNTMIVTKSKFAFVIVAVFDLLKAFIAASVSLYMLKDFWISTLIAGVFSTLGHNYSMFMKFKGGKGASTNVGVLLFINPILGLSFVLILFLITIVNMKVFRFTYNEFHEILYRITATTIAAYYLLPNFTLHVLIFQLISVLKYLTEKQWNKHLFKSFK